MEVDNHFSMGSGCIIVQLSGFQRLNKGLKRGLERSYFWFLSLTLLACGGEKSIGKGEATVIGFLSDYVPPSSNFDQPKEIDTNFKKLEVPLQEGYWISSLEMDNGEIELDHLLKRYDDTITFSFPKEVPSYLPVTITGWAPANENIINASRKILIKLEEIIDIKIEETELVGGLNNLSISQSIQVLSAGLSYFPNNFYELGSDVFLAKGYSTPLKYENGLTNYDYEVLLHEIGHALGLKHPFETDRNNISILNTNEDKTKFTAMSYNENSDTLDGTFRPLDWMTLTKLYGVNPEFRSDDDIYKFDNSDGVFIVDGGGIDTIDASGLADNIHVDLRCGTHSYKGQKSTFITSSNQLTISHGSNIENVETGSGADLIIGNNISNNIISGSGRDEIFAGDGSDIIYPGKGHDNIDLSEDIQSQDRVVFEALDEGKSYDTIYGFSQGIEGDVIDLENFNFLGLVILPIVDASNVPVGYIDNCLLRVFGAGLNDANILASSFGYGGIFENLKLSTGMNSILITSNSQDTGETQNIYIAQNDIGYTEVYQIAQFIGNSLDIDNWSLESFAL